ncbi:MAG: arylesterase [Planctomycetota bacterium]|nr:arylesterase [Planctomycetota bacterium]MCX8039535.1 arylesterase [Planctomycetota bacterium]MDW8373340.1 arylesterase [Planctomycetota bacterium]
MWRCIVCLLGALPAWLTAATVVFLGDSLTAGYGVSEEEAYPALVARALAADPRTAGWRVVNAGASGDTSAGAARRLAWVLRARPQAVVVAIGGNDALRGLPVGELEANLRAMIARIREAGARPLLIGMRAPLNLGPDYAAAFAAVYQRVAAELEVPLLPFLLEGIALDPRYNQADLIHPNAEGHRRIAQRVAEWLLPLLAESR